VNYVIAIAFSI